jgi:hypothetical protein
VVESLASAVGAKVFANDELGVAEQYARSVSIPARLDWPTSHGRRGEAHVLLERAHDLVGGGASRAPVAHFYGGAGSARRAARRDPVTMASNPATALTVMFSERKIAPKATAKPGDR